MKVDMNVLVTICARAGSKGVMNKNIRDFCGNPLIRYTLEAYQSFCELEKNLISNIYLALNTDSKELIQQMDEERVDYILIKRKEDLAGDTVAKFDVIKDTMIEAEKICKIDFDVIIDLDLTSPIRTGKDIAGTFHALLENEDADISFSVAESRRSPYFNMVYKKENGYYGTVFESKVVARQQAPICYDMNASIYAYRKMYLISGNMHDRKAVIWVMPDTGILDIDKEMDFELLEVIFKYFIKSNGIYREQFKRINII